MKFKLTSDFNGTSLRGYIRTTYQNLVEVLGEPTLGPYSNEGDGKVSCEWGIEFDDGTIVTVYDWKTGDTPMLDYSWHIGGYPGSPACDYIHLLFQEATVTSAY
jgi:hypothetical protein